MKLVKLKKVKRPSELVQEYVYVNADHVISLHIGKDNETWVTLVTGMSYLVETNLEATADKLSK